MRLIYTVLPSNDRRMFSTLETAISYLSSLYLPHLEKCIKKMKYHQFEQRIETFHLTEFRFEPVYIFYYLNPEINPWENIKGKAFFSELKDVHTQIKANPRYFATLLSTYIPLD